MNQPWQQIENVLGEAFDFQAGLYSRALTLAERLVAEWKPGIDITAALREIKAMMDQVAKSNATIGNIKQQWLQHRQKAMPALSATLQSLNQLITRLAARIQELERLAAACRDQLAPQLDDLHRARKMQGAYAAAGISKRAR